MLNTLNKIDQYLLCAEKSMMVAFGMLLTLIMTAQVILRYFFSAPLFWAEEISVQLLIFITLFGLAYLSKTRQHVFIDFVLNLLGDKWRRMVVIGLDILLLLLIGFICYYAWHWVMRADVQVEMSGTTGLPKYYSYSAVPIALSLLCWHQLVIVINWLLRCAPAHEGEQL